MAHEDAGHYAAKHGAKTRPAPAVEQALRDAIEDSTITCAAAHKIAHTLDVPPAEVGVAVDLMEARLTRCQMGLFGYAPEGRIVQPAGEVLPELAGAIREALVDGRLPCLSSWEIAKRFGLAKMDVACACEALHIKISSCQLGAF
ncbi:MAG: hypothetical protein E4H15_01155 [Syntrophobacterales bacterium]|nr:MAG: hypothetical protein E4H15_01155 [Syntrophobacterales bacterium]